jgi:hypothetical protein
LLKSRRQVLHRRVAEALIATLTNTTEAQPELLAYHFTQAGLTETAIEWWGKAGQRSLERSALAEAGEQFTRALAQIASLPPTSALAVAGMEDAPLRRQQIKFQVGLANVLMHTKGRGAVNPSCQALLQRRGNCLFAAPLAAVQQESRHFLNKKRARNKSVG